MLEFLAVLFVSYVLLCYVLAKNYVSPARTVPAMPPALVGVEIPAGLKAPDPAWATPTLAKGGPCRVVFVFAHGYGGTRSSWEDLMPKLAARGIDAVAPAMPGQDASPQPQVGFGYKEADQMVAAANWARQKAPSAKIIYAGVSMGGAAAWIASEKDPTAAGVVSEGAYARFDEAMYHWFERKAPGASYYLRPVIWIASAIAGLNPSDVVPLKSAEKWKGRPALIIQAGDDQLILRSHADRLAAASGAPMWLVPGAQHAQCYEVKGAEYVDRLVKFAEQVAPENRKLVPISSLGKGT